MSDTPKNIPVTPLKGGAACTIEFDGEVLVLRADDGRVLLMLPREEAATHVRFSWQLPEGRTVSFVIVEGLRAYTYRATPEAVKALLEWLPLRTREALAGELRLHGVGAILAGMAMLLFPHDQLWPYAGVPAVLAGCASVLRSQRSQYGVNAGLFAALGLALLFLPAFLPNPMVQIWPAGFGAVWLLWGVQQASLLAPQHLVDQSQSGDSAPRRILRPGSRVHSVMATITLGCAIPLAALAWRSQASVSLLSSYLVLTVATVVIAFLILARGRQSYRELQLGGQWAVVVLYFLTYGLVWHASLFASDPTPYPLGPIYNFHLPAVSGPLVAVIVVFNIVLRRVIRKRLALEDE